MLARTHARTHARTRAHTHTQRALTHAYMQVTSRDDMAVVGYIRRQILQRMLDAARDEAAVYIHIRSTHERDRENGGREEKTERKKKKERKKERKK